MSMDMQMIPRNPDSLHECLGYIPSGDDDSAAIIYESDSEIPETLSYKELDYYASLITGYLQPLMHSTKFIGVICRPGLALPPILLGILRAGLGYYCFDHKSDLSESKSLMAALEMDTFVIENVWAFTYWDEYPELRPTRSVLQIDLKNYCISLSRTPAFRLSRSPDLQTDLYTWAYVSRTSGTTGKRKIILVPHASIVPNIEDFVNIEKIDKNDVIFGASPPTFDPFNVDLFSVLRKRAKLLIVSDSVKLNPKMLAHAILRNGVTIIHCTPSLLSRFTEVETTILFSAESNIRVLALGGERCLEKCELRRLVPAEKRSQLLLINMYGTTEVSCWASLDKINLDNDDPISIGESMGETNVCMFDNDYTSQIYIGSKTRICTVINEEDGSTKPPKVVNGTTYRETGDIGERGEDGQILYSGRLDRMIKRHGHFVNLTDIENRVLLTDLVTFAAAFYLFGKIYLIVRFKKDSEKIQVGSQKDMLGKCLEMCLPIHYYPDKIIVISEDVPVTENGKFDVSYVKDIIRAEQCVDENKRPSDCLQINYPPEDVNEFILTTWKNNTGNRKDFHSSDTFFEAGGNSPRAVRFIEEIMQGLLKFGTRIHADEEITFMNTLNRSSFDVVRKYIFKSICESKPHHVEVSSLRAVVDAVNDATYIKDNKCWFEPGYKRLPFTARTSFENKINDINLTLQIPIVSREWTIDLLGCVDASPLILENEGFRCHGRIALVGSHSGYVGAVNLEVLRELRRTSDVDSSLLWRKKFPDRIATTAGYHKSQMFAFIVCCDETMYTVCVETGAIRWLFHINGLIRSPPVCNEDGTVVYLLSAFPNGQLTALNFENGAMLWSTSLAFVCSPLSIAVNSAGIFVTSADVALIKFAHAGGYIHCRGDVERACTPPLIMDLDNGNLILVGTVNGTMVAYDENLLQLIWTYYGPEKDPVNPPYFHQCDSHPGLVLYTTHSGVFRILDARTGSLRQKVKLKIESRSTPSCFTKLKIEKAGGSPENCICCAVLTDVVGGLHFVDIESGKKIGVIQPSHTMECFSSAVVCGDLVVYGGRSNKLHVVQLQDVTGYITKIFDWMEK